jgi:hypothetical protein
MPDWKEIYSSTIDGAIYDLIKYLFAPIVMSGVFALVGQYLEWFKNFRQLLLVSAAVFVISLMCFSIFAPRSQSPQLAGTIESVLMGPMNDGKDTIAVFVVNVVNSGTMQSIIKNWSITSTINSRTYAGALLVPPPPAFTFTSQDKNVPSGTASSITYHGDDDLLAKTNVPIPAGGLTKGVLFILFRGVSSDVFKTGADFTIGYEDALSKRYSVYITSTAQAAPIPVSSGIHAELMCPISPPSAPPAAAPNFTPRPPVATVPSTGG